MPPKNSIFGHKCPAVFIKALAFQSDQHKKIHFFSNKLFKMKLKCFGSKIGNFYFETATLLFDWFLF